MLTHLPHPLTGIDITVKKLSLIVTSHYLRNERALGVVHWGLSPTGKTNMIPSRGQGGGRN